MELKKIGSIVALALCFGIYYYFTHSLRDRQREMIYEAEGYVAWDEEKAKEVFQQSDELLDSAIHALQAHKREEARLLYNEAVTNAALYLENHRDKQLESDLTIGEWKKLRNGVYLGILLDELDHLSGLLGSGDIKAEAVEWFVRGYSDMDLRPLKQTYEDREKDLEKTRSQKAPKWLRLRVYDSTGGMKYEKTIAQEVAGRWTPDYGFKLVLGKSLGPVEEKAIWKRLTIHANEKSAYYEFQGQGGDNQFVNRSPPVIPYKLTLSFKIEGNSAIPTSWDNLSEITLDAPAPETLYLSHNSSRSLDEGDRLETESRKILQDKLRQELGNLPVFRLFPGLDAGQLTIIGNNGKVDRKSATALAYLSPGKFSAQLKNALKIDSRSGRGELMGLVVDLGLEEHSGWLLQSLETAGLYDQKQVLEAI